VLRLGQFIIEYWLEVVFGLVVTVMGLFIRHYRKLYIESKDNKEKVLWTNIKKAIMDDHNDIIKEVFTRGDQFEADRQ
jgi:hypothetical protein